QYEASQIPPFARIFAAKQQLLKSVFVGVHQFGAPVRIPEPFAVQRLLGTDAILSVSFFEQQKTRFTAATLIINGDDCRTGIHIENSDSADRSGGKLCSDLARLI